MASYIKFSRIANYPANCEFEIETGVCLNDNELVSFVSRTDDLHSLTLFSHTTAITSPVHSWNDLVALHLLQVQEMIRVYNFGRKSAEPKKEIV